MAAPDISMTRSVMMLMHIFAGAMRKYGTPVFWAKLILTGSVEEKRLSVRAVMEEVIAQYLAIFPPNDLARANAAGKEWLGDCDEDPEDDDAAEDADGLDAETLAYVRGERAKEVAGRRLLREKVYPRRRRLYFAQMKSRFAVWRRFAALLRLLSALSQIRDEKPVLTPSPNCALIVPVG